MAEARIAQAALFLLVLLSYLWDGPSVVAFGHITLAPVAGGVAALPEAGGDLARQACFLILFATVMIPGVRARGADFLIRVPITFVIPLAWCWLSIAWAIDPGASFRRVLFTTIVILNIAYAVQLTTYRQVISLVMIALALILIIDLASMAVFPLAIHQEIEAESLLAGAWRGMHNHKNAAGAFAAICLIFGLNETARVRSVLTGPALVLGTAFFLFKTQAKTSEGIVVVSLMIGLLVGAAYRHRRIRSISALTALLVLVICMAFADDLLGVSAATFDDPAALTGRVQIWPLLLDYAADHPLLGAGYGSFWAIGDASPIFHYGAGWVGSIDHSHNGYLEILIQTGVLGLGLSVFFLVLQPFWALFSQPLYPEVSRLLIASVLAFGCLRDLLETSLLYRSNPTWVMMVIMYCLLSKARLPQQPMKSSKRTD